MAQGSKKDPESMTLRVLDYLMTEGYTPPKKKPAKLPALPTSEPPLGEPGEESGEELPEF